MPANETREITFKHLLEYCNRVSPEVNFMEYKTGGQIEARTYSDLKRDCDAFSNFLAGKGYENSHIALVGGASYAWAVSFLGIVCTSSAAVPLAPSETDIMNEKLFDFADCTAFVFDEKHRPLYEKISNSTDKQILFISSDNKGDGKTVYNFSDIIGQNQKEYTGCPTPETLCAIMFTSGTTGFPKGVMLTHKNFMYTGMSVHNAYPTQRMMGCLPFHHAFGLTGNITKTMVNSRTLCLNDNLQNLLSDFKLYKPNGMLAVPQIVKYVMNAAIQYAETKKDTMAEPQAVQEFLGGGMVDIASGAAPLEADINLRFNKTGININNGYGMTECAPIVSNNVEGYTRAGSVGRPIPCLNVKIQDGEILIKGPNVMKGYYKNPEATKGAFTEDGWFLTGDLGRLDEDGYLFITGRKKNLILLDNGENVSAEFLEGKFAAEKSIKELMCYGENGAIYAEFYPDKAYFEKNPGSDVNTVFTDAVERVNKTLTTFQHISGFTVRTSPFERTASGKIKRCVTHAKVKRDIVKPSTPAEKKVAAAVCDLLRLPEVSMTDNFFALGGNSLNVVELALTLNIRVQSVYDNSFLSSLAQVIDAEKNDNIVRKSGINTLIAETKTQEKAGEYKTVLLTGATGFLGVHILKALTDAGKTVYCLVRSEKKLTEQLAYYFKDFSSDLIIPVKGDIEQPLLGLSQSEYNLLAEKIDTVFHTAANVHHNGDYADLERTNVLGTENLIDFCKKADAVLQHTSTVSVHGAATVIQKSEKEVFDENILDIGQHFGDNVYIHSKYRAEEAVISARKEGLKANIYRIGNLTWRTTDGRFQRNSDDNGFLHRIRAIVKLGIYHENMDKYPMDLTAVDECADAYVKLALSGKINGIFHLFNDNFLDVRDMLKYLDKPCRFASTAETIELCMANEQDRDISVYLFYMIISGRSSEVKMINEETKAALAELGFRWSIPDKSYLTANDGTFSGHCTDFAPFTLLPVRNTGGSLSPIGKLTLGVLRDASPKPYKLIAGSGSIQNIKENLTALGAKKPLIITVPFSLPGMDRILSDFGAGVPVFTDIAAEPTVADTDNALKTYIDNGCDSVVAVGGGSVLDTAKITSLRAANPDRYIEDICKLDSECLPSVPLIVAPSTAGTGSEVTLFAVATEQPKNKKRPFTNDKFQPDVIILDPLLTESVPKMSTAFTGIDALSHAVESYLSLFAPAFPEDAKNAPKAVKTVFDALPKAFDNPHDIKARADMQKAAFEAGISFGRIGTGYIHAIAHRLGEFYHIPHGLAIAVTTVPVLKAYMPYGADKLAELSDRCNLTDNTMKMQDKADFFIGYLDSFIRSFGISAEDIPFNPDDVFEIARKAQEEAKVIGYPRPFTDEQVMQLVKEIFA